MKKLKQIGRKILEGLGRKWHYILVMVFGVILSVGLWGYLVQFTQGDDFAFHITRMQGASHAWSNGQILPQVDPDALGGFGYAYNIFYGPLVTYVAAGLKVIVGAWPVAVNLTLILLLMGSGILMCYAMMKISGKKGLAALIAIIYMAAPYHLTDLYSRMAIGEVAALCFAPILLLGLYQLINQESHATRSLAVAAALLVLTHSLSALLFAAMAAVFVLLNIRKICNLKSIWRMVLAVIVALGLTAFFILPLIEVQRVGIYGVMDAGYLEKYFGANGQSMNDHRLWPSSLLLTDSYIGALDLAMGVVAIVGLIGFWFVRRKIENDNERRLVTSLYVIAILALLVVMPILDWHMMPLFLRQMQFPWRLMEIFTFAMSVVSGYVLYTLIQGLAEEKQKVLVVIMGLVAIYPMVGIIIPKEERNAMESGVFVEKATSGSVGWQAEYAPMQLLCDPENEEDLEKGYACSLAKIDQILETRGMKLRIVDGQAKLGAMEKDGLRVSFEVENADLVTKVELPLIYYPGYAAEMAGEKLEVEPSEKYGMVEVVIPAGKSGKVEVKYGLSRPTLIGMIVSGATAGLGLIWVVISGIVEKRRAEKQKEMEKLMDSVREVMEQSEAMVKLEEPKVKTSRARKTASASTKTRKKASETKSAKVTTKKEKK